jgi:hypothetical protein
VNNNNNIVLLQFSTTRDHSVTLEDGSTATSPTKPWGPGWSISDSHRERFTVWWRARKWGER